MRIVVCVKHVPDIHGPRELGEDGRLVRGGDDVLNELDEHAVATAVRIAAAHGGEVVALTLGPDGARRTVRRALQLGAAHGVHVDDPAIAGSDVVATARVLAAAVRRIDGDRPVDLIVTGMASLDGLTSMIPAALAAVLDLPQLTLATDVEVRTDDDARAGAGGVVLVTRQIDGAVERLRSPLPAVVSVTDLAPGPGVPDVMAMLAAKSRPVTTWSLADLGLSGEDVGTAGSAVVLSSAEPRPPRAGGTVVEDEGDAGIRLAEYLLEHSSS